MFRATNNVYARFADIFDPPEEPRAVFCEDGKIEFVDPNGETTSTSAEVNGNAGGPTEAPIRRKINNKKVILFLVLCIVVFLLVILTTTNFALVLQHRPMVFANSDQLATLENSEMMVAELDMVNKSVQVFLSNWSVQIVARLKDELRVKPEQIKSTVRDEIAKWSADNIPKIKEKLHVAPSDIDSKVQSAMETWKTNNLPQLKEELRQKPEHFDARMKAILSNWTRINVPRIKDELRIKQDQLDRRIQQAIMNWSNGTEHVKPEHVNATVHAALTNWEQGLLEAMQNSVSPDIIAQEFDASLLNLSHDIVLQLKTELGIAPLQLQQTIDRSLSNLTENVLKRLREELKITPIQLEQGIRKAMANMSERALALIRGICEISYNEKCYWVVKSGPITFGHAESLCHNRGAEVANVYNDEHYNKMVAYLRNKMPPLKTVWLGMTRNVTAGITYLQNGDVLNYTLTWYPGYPLDDAVGRTQLGYHVEKEPPASNQGFFNDFPHHKRHGILCEL